MDRGIRWSPEDVVFQDGRYLTSSWLRVVWCLFGAGFCLFLVQAGVEAVTGDRPVVLRVLLLLVVVGYGTGYVVLPLWALGRPLPVRAAVVTGMVALYVVVVLGLGPSELDTATFALVVAAILVGWPWSMALCAVLIGGVALLGIAIGTPIGLGHREAAGHRGGGLDAGRGCGRGVSRRARGARRDRAARGRRGARARLP